MKVPRAWVITLEGTDLPEEVIAIVSARRSEEYIKHTLELLYGLLHYNAEEQLAAAQWTRPSIPYEAAPILRGQRTAFSCGHNPFLVARLARDVRLNTSRKVHMLEWQQPDRFEAAASGPLKRTEGKMRSAPVRLRWPHRGRK
jgi:hypothetical protein